VYESGFFYVVFVAVVIVSLLSNRVSQLSCRVLSFMF